MIFSCKLFGVMDTILCLFFTINSVLDIPKFVPKMVFISSYISYVLSKNIAGAFFAQPSRGNVTTEYFNDQINVQHDGDRDVQVNNKQGDLCIVVKKMLLQFDLIVTSLRWKEQFSVLLFFFCYNSLCFSCKYCPTLKTKLVYK